MALFLSHEDRIDGLAVSALSYLRDARAKLRGIAAEDEIGRPYTEQQVDALLDDAMAEIGRLRTIHRDFHASKA